MYTRFRGPALARASPAWLLGLAACGGSQGAPAAARRARALAVRVAPARSQDVVYEIKALGSLEAEEMVQVTAEVEGAVSDVHFHEGDRVGTGHRAGATSTPSATALECERAEANLRQARGRGRPGAERAGPARGAGRGAARGGGGAPARPDATPTAWSPTPTPPRPRATSRARTCSARRVRAPRAGVINTRSVETGQFVRTGDVLATHRGHEPPAPALQGLGGGVAARAHRADR